MTAEYIYQTHITSDATIPAESMEMALTYAKGLVVKMERYMTFFVGLIEAYAVFFSLFPYSLLNAVVETRKVGRKYVSHIATEWALCPHDYLMVVGELISVVLLLSGFGTNIHVVSAARPSHAR